MTDKIKFKLKSAPKKPGCYLWKDKHGDIIYVGKALNINNRVKQYFNRLHDFKTSQLVQDIDDVEFFVVNTENEALILENNLIKKHRPKYNILLKDSSGYPYIIVTNEQHPRIKYSRNTKIKGTYYGPFASKNFYKKELLELLNELFPLRKCDQLKKKKCLYYDIGQCLGPCINKIQPETYSHIKNQIHQFFSGNTTELSKQLKQKEKFAVEQLKFEDANHFKNLQSALAQIKENQTVQIGSKDNVDFLGFATQKNLISIILFSYVGGKLLAKIQEIHEYYENDINSIISSWLYQYYSKCQNKPKTLFLSLPKKEFKALQQTLDLNIVKPIKGTKYEILMTAHNNAIEYLKTNYIVYLANKKAKLSSLMTLAQMLHVEKIKTIVSFDISNLFAANKVAGMIYLNNGEFVRNRYRKYIIDDQSLNSDYECMKYVIGKFVDHHKDELPDLIIMDGGKIQVNAAREVFAVRNIKSPLIIGLVKNNNHQTNGIVFNNQTIKLDKDSNLYNFLANIQNEVHNTAISFYRKKHEQSLFDTSILPDIPGLSKNKKELLLDKYKTVSNIKKATISELSQIIDVSIAKALKKAL